MPVLSLRHPLIVSTTLSALLLIGCDRTEPADEAVVDTVDIEQTEPLTAGESVGEANIEVVDGDDTDNNSAVLAEANEANPTTCVDMANIEAPSIVTNTSGQIGLGSPEATILQAMNTLYYSCAEDAVQYYMTQDPEFIEQLQTVQSAIRSDVGQIVLQDAQATDEDDMVRVPAEFILKPVTQSTDATESIQQSDVVEFQLQRVDGEWKIAS